MYYHEDDYGGQSWDDTPEIEEQESYGDYSYDDECYYDLPDVEPTKLSVFRSLLRLRLMQLRYLVDRKYRKQIDDIPF